METYEIKIRELGQCLKRQIKRHIPDLKPEEQDHLLGLLMGAVMSEQDEGQMIALSERTIEFLMSGIECGLIEKFYRSVIIGLAGENDAYNERLFTHAIRQTITQVECLSDAQMCMYLLLLKDYRDNPEFVPAEAARTISLEAQSACICRSKMHCEHRRRGENGLICEYRSVEARLRLIAGLAEKRLAGENEFGDKLTFTFCF